MKILLNNQVLNSKLRPFSDIGFVPTMGGIHKGHVSLINKSKKLCKITIVSIFVNPKQFNSKKDFKTYPFNTKKDLSILKKVKGINFVYIPKLKDIYGNKRTVNIKINQKDKILCAKYRKGHFEGVLNVMNILTRLIKPNKIFMGEKDYQQLILVKNFIEEKYKTKVIGCKTIRNNEKLALSSRNLLLNNKELNVASKITKEIFSLKKIIKSKININRFLSSQKNKLQKKFQIKIEYLEHRNKKNLMLSNKYNESRIFFSYYMKGVRFIDNF